MGSAEPLGTLEVALRHAARLLEKDPAAAAEQAAEILKVHPDQPDALALSGLALGRLGRGEESILALRRAVHFKPELPEAWRAIGDHYSALGMREAVDEAFAQHLRHSTHDPRVMRVALALYENRIPDAEGELREHLKRHPTDVLAIRMLAEVAARIGRTHDAETLLARCVQEAIAPGGAAADAAALPAPVVEALGTRMAALDPQAEITLDFACPACGTPGSVVLDAAELFFRELDAHGQDLYREVHRLALHYHWSERDILALPNGKRRRYLALLADALGDA